MRPITILVVAIWVWVVGSNIAGVLFRDPEVMKPFANFPWQVGFFPILILIGVFFRPKRPRSHKMLIKFVDRRFGEGKWEEFSQMLRPELMFSTMASCIVIADLVRGYATGQFSLPPVLNVFFATGAVTFLIAYFIRKSREQKS